MYSSTLLAWAATAAIAQASYIGFNYGSTFTDGSAKQQSDFEAEFNAAKGLPGTNGEFTSARIYTMIQAGTTDTPISAIPAAIDTKTSLLLGLWASAGQADFTNEVTALTSAITQYGSDFTSLIAGISVGSEDLYRISPTGIENLSGAGADPAVLVDYINQVRSAIKGTPASGASIGHVDTWTAWVNGSNNAVIEAVDWLGMDAYPYFENTLANSITAGNATFYDAYDNTVGAAQGKSVWVTETGIMYISLSFIRAGGVSDQYRGGLRHPFVGYRVCVFGTPGWPVSGKVENQAVASVQNAETYWQEVGCSLFGKVNTWWYVLQDALPTTPNPSFGIIASSGGAPLYDLTCTAGTSSSSAASSATSSAASSTVHTASAATTPASSAGANTESVSQATPGPEPSPTSVSVAHSSAGSATQTGGSQAVSTLSGSVGTASPAPSSIESASAVSMPTSYMTSMSPAVGSVGRTFTTRMTTLVTITACPSSCSESVTTISPSAGQTTVVTISGSSQASGSVPVVSPPTASPSPAKSSAVSPPAASGSSCPANLNGEYQYPHLIVPVDSANPDKAYGTQYNGTVTPTISTIFNFDLPASYAGRTCSLVFLFPTEAALETSAYAFNGKGGITINELSSPATEQTTYNTLPKAAISGIGSIPSLQPGNSYVVASHACNAGNRQSFEFVSEGGLSLEFFEDYNPSPLGAYITVC